MMKKSGTIDAIPLLFLVGSLLAGCSRDKEEPPAPPSVTAPAATAPATAPAPSPSQAGDGAAARGVELPSFVNLVKQQGGTVVNISTRRMREGGSAQLPPNHPLYEFFRRFGGTPDSGEVPSGGIGSGFVISADGFILTNAHVVDRASEIVVRLTNKREYPAKLIGADPVTDVALLKIDASGLPAVRVAGTQGVEVGEWVAAIGAPFGFESSVTVGVVSAKSRLLPEGSYVPFIQTDVAVNPGNSGGPLFSTRGEVVGINSAIWSQTGGYMGISFAIPIDLAMGIAQQLRESGRVVRGRIGVQLQELSYDLATSFGLKEAIGAVIAGVERGGPADRAGVKPGDVVLALNGQPVQTTADLARLVGGTKPGDTVKLQIWRNKNMLTEEVKVVEQRAS